MCDTCREPDLDDIPAEELGEQDPMHTVVRDALRARDGAIALAMTELRPGHFVGTFLDELAAHGYRVTAIDAPNIDKLLGPPVD